MSNKQGQPPYDHKVEAGDTFSNLAAAYYGDGSDAKSKKIAPCKSWCFSYRLANWSNAEDSCLKASTSCLLNTQAEMNVTDLRGNWPY